MPIHEKLRKLRLNLELSQQAIADKLHISQNSYSLIESGKTKIDEQRLFQFAAIFNISPAELLTGDAINLNPYNKIENRYVTNIQALNTENKDLIGQLAAQLTKKDEQISYLLKQIEYLLTLVKT